MTETELRTYVDVSHEDGVIESEEKEMIYNVFDFSDSISRDIMIPRIDMICIEENAGYDFFKLHPGLSRANFDALAKKAKEVGMRYAGHVSYDVGVWRAIESGYASIDHLDGFVVQKEKEPV